MREIFQFLLGNVEFSEYQVPVAVLVGNGFAGFYYLPRSS
jgi:hypothetical protein